jgi:hypothetical protein
MKKIKNKNKKKTKIIQQIIIVKLNRLTNTNKNILTIIKMLSCHILLTLILQIFCILILRNRLKLSFLLK